MIVAEVTPISTRAINNLGGRTWRRVQILKIEGDKALMRLFTGNTGSPYKADWYVEGKDFRIHDARQEL